MISKWFLHLFIYIFNNFFTFCQLLFCLLQLFVYILLVFVCILQLFVYIFNNFFTFCLFCISKLFVYIFSCYLHLSAVCLHFQLFIYLFSCLFTFSAIYLHFSVVWLHFSIVHSIFWPNIGCNLSTLNWAILDPKWTFDTVCMVVILKASKGRMAHSFER